MTAGEHYTLAVHAVAQLAVAGILALVAGISPGDGAQTLSAVLFGWGVFVVNAGMIALVAAMLMRRQRSGKSAPQALALRAAFLGVKGFWVALAVYVGLVVLRLRGDLLVVGAVASLAAFTLTVFALARSATLSEKS